MQSSRQDRQQKIAPDRRRRRLDAILAELSGIHVCRAATSLHRFVRLTMHREGVHKETLFVWERIYGCRRLPL
jgi:hypothetical protein